MNINSGISEKGRKEIAEGLSKFLADTYTLYLKTHNFHWNVTGPYFQQLHLMWETQYNELWQAVDEIAERIRALGFRAPGSGTEFGKLARIKEATGDLSWDEMTKQLVEGHELLAREARELFPVADSERDQATADLVNIRMRNHEKTAWMLRSLLQ